MVSRKDTCSRCDFEFRPLPDSRLARKREERQHKTSSSSSHNTSVKDERKDERDNSRERERERERELDREREREHERDRDHDRDRLDDKALLVSYQMFYCLIIVSPRTKYVRGILWFSRRYAAASAASAYHRLRDNLKNPNRIASIFDMYIDIGERIAGKQDGPGSIIYGPPGAP